MRAFAGCAASYAAFSTLFSLILGPVAATFAILFLTVIAGLGIVILMAQREKHQHEDRIRLPVARGYLEAQSHLDS